MSIENIFPFWCKCDSEFIGQCCINGLLNYLIYHSKFDEIDKWLLKLDEQLNLIKYNIKLTKSFCFLNRNYGPVIHQCMHPQCNGVAAIKSHVMSSGSQLKNLTTQEDNLIYIPKNWNNSKDKVNECGMRCVGVNHEDVTFPLFCADHDSKIFSPIDDSKNVKDDAELMRYFILVSYRSLCAELSIEKIYRNFISYNCVKKIKSYKNVLLSVKNHMGSQKNFSISGCHNYSQESYKEIIYSDIQKLGGFKNLFTNEMNLCQQRIDLLFKQKRIMEDILFGDSLSHTKYSPEYVFIELKSNPFFIHSLGKERDQEMLTVFSSVVVNDNGIKKHGILIFFFKENYHTFKNPRIPEIILSYLSFQSDHFNLIASCMYNVSRINCFYIKREWFNALNIRQKESIKNIVHSKSFNEKIYLHDVFKELSDVGDFGIRAKNISATGDLANLLIVRKKILDRKCTKEILNSYMNNDLPLYCKEILLSDVLRICVKETKKMTRKSFLTNYAKKRTFPCQWFLSEYALMLLEFFGESNIKVEKKNQCFFFREVVFILKKYKIKCKHSEKIREIIFNIFEMSDDRDFLMLK